MTENKIQPVLTPSGYISFPYLDAPDTGRPNSSGKYTAQLFISKEEWKAGAADLVASIKAAGSQLLGREAGLGDFKNTIYDVDAMPEHQKAKLPAVVRTGFIQIRTATTRAPIVKDADAALMPMPEIKNIGGGDLCRFVVAPYPYSNNGGGVALGLNCVQFIKKTDAKFGGGTGAGADLIQPVAVEPSSPVEAAVAADAVAPSAVPASDFETFN